MIFENVFSYQTNLKKTIIYPLPAIEITIDNDIDSIALVHTFLIEILDDQHSADYHPNTKTSAGKLNISVGNQNIHFFKMSLLKYIISKHLHCS